MNIGTLWFDRLRNRLGEEIEREQVGAIPGILDETPADLPAVLRSLEAAQPLIISGDISKRIAPNGEPSEDLKRGFDMPFDRSFVEIDPAVKLPGVSTGRVRGILISRRSASGRWGVRVWVEHHGKAQYSPAMTFSFSPSDMGEMAPENRQMANFLIWLSGYINSPNVLAVRHNRRHDLVRSYERRGLAAPSSYYTFEPERSGMPSLKMASGRAGTVDVKGHFRRAHWHRLAGGGSAWFHTSWVRPHKRLAPVASAPELEEAA